MNQLNYGTNPDGSRTATTPAPIGIPAAGGQDDFQRWMQDLIKKRMESQESEARMASMTRAPMLGVNSKGPMLSRASGASHGGKDISKEAYLQPGGSGFTAYAGGFNQMGGAMRGNGGPGQASAGYGSAPPPQNMVFAPPNVTGPSGASLSAPPSPMSPDQDPRFLQWMEQLKQAQTRVSTPGFVGGRLA